MKKSVRLIDLVMNTTNFLKKNWLVYINFHLLNENKNNCYIFSILARQIAYN